MVSRFVGIRYKLDKSVKFDEYLKAFGVNLLVRKLVNSLSPVVELIENSDNSYTIKSTSSFRTMSVTFRLGEEFTQETPDGRKVQTIITQEGDSKLIEVQMGDKPTTVVREFTKETLYMTLTVDDIVCTRNYKVVES